MSLYYVCECTMDWSAGVHSGSPMYLLAPRFPSGWCRYTVNLPPSLTHTYAHSFLISLRVLQPISCSLRKGIWNELPQHPKEREREGDAVRQRGRGGGCYRSERPSELSRLRSGSYVASRQRRGRVKEEGKQNHLPEKDTWGEALLLPPASPCSIWMICRSVAAALISHCCWSHQDYCYCDCYWQINLPPLSVCLTIQLRYTDTLLWCWLSTGRKQHFTLSYM